MQKTTISISKDVKYALMRIRAELKVESYDDAIQKLLEVWEAHANERATKK